MEEFPSNSQNVVNTGKAVRQQKAAPVEKDPVTKVVTDSVIHKKPSLGKKFKDVFFGGEFKGAVHYITGDVLLPAFKKLVVDATSMGMERLIYGDTNPRRMRRPDIQNPSRVLYNSPVNRDPRTRTMLPDQPPYSPPSRHQDQGELIVISRTDAENVVERLSDIIDKYEVASVADLHALVGLPATYVDNKWGWTNLAFANIKQVREGYLIDLPPVEPI